MIVGIPRERFVDERRVGLAPSGVRALTEAGATVYIEQEAGLAAGWPDAEYEASGAKVVYSAEEALGRADLVLKVLPPTPEEVEVLRDDTTLLSYLQLTLAGKQVFADLVERKATAIALENIEYDGIHPVRRAMSEIAGALAVDISTDYLGADRGGRGVLIGGVPGVPPASVGILGAGVVGTAAAEVALNLGASVILVDKNVAPLREAIAKFGHRIQTAVINPSNIDKMVRFVDVLIGAVLIEDAVAPHVVSRKQVQTMKARSVIVDIAIDQGGSVETSRPTTLHDPVYIEENVIHYCVPNIPAKVPRTSTRAFQNQVLPMAMMMLEKGMPAALREHPYMVSGLNLFQGIVTRDVVAETFGSDWKRPEEVLS